MAKLVAIGDSLTQGFQSGAITHCDLSYPAMVARCMGLDVTSFRTPDFTGAGGLPVNLEWLATQLQNRVSSRIGTFAWPKASFEIIQLLDEVEDYWERGRGALPSGDVLYHNLAVWGFTAGDAYRIDARTAMERARKSKDEWFAPPSEPEMRTAWRVLNPSQSQARMEDTQIRAAKRIKERDGEIENLIVWLGANNCLRTVMSLVVDETDDVPPALFSEKTLWSKAAFTAEMAELARQIESIGSKNVFMATVPHVTIAPLAKGIMANRGRLPLGEKYFDFYTRFFIADDRFDADRDRHLTKAQAMMIDARIDDYNATIVREAGSRNWHVVDMCSVLDKLAVKRNYGRPEYPLPPALSDLDVRFLDFSPDGDLRQGGLFSLDGIHPTACGYAIIAAEFIRKINAVTGTAYPEPDYETIRADDTLVTHAPTTLHDVMGMLSFLERRFHMTRWVA